MGKLQEFEILFDHPQAVYKAGETLQGRVLIVLDEPMKMRNLRLWLSGRAKVHWTKTKHTGKSSHTTHYRAEEISVNETLILFGTPQNDGMDHPAGRHEYPFSLYLRPDLPSSFEGECGFVRYLCKATIDKPWKFDHDTKAAFTVISHLDLNAEPQQLRTVMEGTDSTEVSCCCCVSGKVTATFRINKRGFVPGESIIVNADVQNSSNTSVTSTRFSLKQYVEFYGVSDSLFSSGTPKPYSVSNYIATHTQGEIAAGQSQKWENVPICIPPIPPSRLVGCNCINIAYVAKFYVSVNYGTDIKLSCDVVIGTIPLYGSLMDPAPSYAAVTAQPQPSAPVLPYPTDAPALDPSAPPPPPAVDQYPNFPPPSYEEWVGGKREIREDGDTEFTRGRLQWAPSYPTYKHFSVDTQQPAPPSAQNNML